MPSEAQICKPPTRSQAVTDTAFRALCQGFTWLVAIIAVIIVLKIVVAALPAVRQYGFGFLSGHVWDPHKKVYSILPEIWGKFPVQVENLLSNLIELLAAIPSVVYGLWGLFVIIPLIRPVCHWLHADLGWIPLFGTNLSGPGMLPAVIVLSIMILPTITAIGRGSLLAVPTRLRMAAYGLGATRWEAIFAVTLPTASRGIFGGIVLAFGRALGETMALAMLVGNANVISVSLFSPANTLAALLAN